MNYTCIMVSNAQLWIKVWNKSGDYANEKFEHRCIIDIIYFAVSSFCIMFLKHCQCHIQYAVYNYQFELVRMVMPIDVQHYDVTIPVKYVQYVFSVTYKVLLVACWMMSIYYHLKILVSYTTYNFI